MVSDIEQMFKNAGVVLDTQLLTEGVAELKRQYPLISDNDYHQLIKFDPTYKGGNELGKYGRWILDLYNLFVKDRNNEEKYEKAKAYVAEHPEAKMPPAPVQKSQDRIEDFQKIPELLKDLESHLNDIKDPIQSFKSVAELATAVNNAVEKDISVGKRAQKNYKIFREAMADGLKVVYQDNDWIIGVPETYEASSHFKKPVTNWCTAYPDMYEKYMSEYGGKYYIHLNKHTGDLYQLHAESDQFKDRNDKEINKEEFIGKNPQLKDFYNKTINPTIPTMWVLHNNRPSEEEIKRIITLRPYLLKEIPNPSKELQLAAVSASGTALGYIQNPTKEVRLAALKQNGGAISFIPNPSKEERLIAVKSTPYAIKYIPNPTEEEQLEAVGGDGAVIRFISDPSEAVQLKAVEETPDAFQMVKNPTEASKILAVSKRPSLIELISKPSAKVQMAAISLGGENIKYIKNPCEKAQIAAIKEDGWFYRYIKQPTPKATKLFHDLYG